MTTPFVTLTGTAAVLPLANIDTDIIIRIERLTEGDQSRLGEYAFESLRYRDDGSDDPDFPLNRPEWRGAPILLAGPNFGCGSSREGAVTALAAMGIRCVIAPSYGDIFYANCFQNGLLPIRLDSEEIDRLIAAAERLEPMTVDLEAQTVAAGVIAALPFEIDPMRRESLLTGLDDLGRTLRDADLINTWQAADWQERPWIWQTEIAL
uniref:3-isopropylmalate dehydratase n=1 Tax=Caulobacter sp. (strain K31) TaxID=366602 RepID=B0T6M5_CAUSK